MNRRLFLRGLVATPAVVAASSLMPIRGIVLPLETCRWTLPYRDIIGAMTAWERAQMKELWRSDHSSFAVVDLPMEVARAVANRLCERQGHGIPFVWRPYATLPHMLLRFEYQPLV